ncbi:MAG: helix-turn-helix transcriptional regulator [Acidobacteriota bacterium]|nr:MAG: helix-turn-helix transcriptional regulator [Acidobacteriota bacterium]
MTFAEIVRLHREKHGLNKKQLAEKVGVTQPYIVQIENDGKIPGDGVVLRLADALGLSRRELLFSAYRARASEDIRHFFNSIFDDLTPTEEFSQPFIEARKDQFESPDFSLRHLSTSSDRTYQVSVLKAKTPDASFSTHAHSVPQVLVAVEGTFEVMVGDEVIKLSKDGLLSTVVPARTPHRIKATSVGRMLTVTLGAVVRTAAQGTASAASVAARR